VQSFWQTLVWRTVVDSVSGPSQFLFGLAKSSLGLFRRFMHLCAPYLWSTPLPNTLYTYDLASVSNFYGRRLSCPFLTWPKVEFPSLGQDVSFGS